MLLSEPPVVKTSAPASKRISVRTIAIVLSVAAAASLVVWRYTKTTNAPQYQFARVERGTVEARVSTTGTCNAIVSVQVGSLVSGNIKALYADFNSVVKAGQLIAQIDPVMFEAKVAQADAAWRNSEAALANARANVVKAAADVSGAKATQADKQAAIVKSKSAVTDAQVKLARRKQMLAEQILSQEDFDTAQATYDQAIADQNAALAEYDAAVHSVASAQAALEAARTQVNMIRAEVDSNKASLDQARIDLSNTRIVSPVDGTVVARQMDVGQTVAASFQAPTIFQIAQDLTKMQIDTNIDESDVGRLSVGQLATFRVDAYPGTQFTGPILQIRKAAINVQNVITYDAVIRADNPDLKLFPGMTANVSILTNRVENVLRVPNAALRFRPSEAKTVWVMGSDGNPQAVHVQLGISDGLWTQVVHGDLTEGQQIIVGSKAKTATVQPQGPGAASTPGMRRF